MKLDREKLPALAFAAWSRAGLGATGEYVDERASNDLTPIETVIVSTWKRLLGIDGVAINKDDDFFALGGNSILAIKAARSIEASTGQRIPVALLIQETILERVAKAITRHIASSSSSKSTAQQTLSSYLSGIKEAKADGQREPAHYSSTTLPLSYLEEGLFHAHLSAEIKSAFNTVAQFVIHGPMNVELLAEAFTALVRETPILRARYIASEGHPVRLISGEVSPPQRYLGHELDYLKLQTLVNESFNLAEEQLLKMILWEKGGVDKETEVIMIMHHIITDQSSMEIILQWVSRNYRGLVDQRDGSHAEIDDLSAEGTYIDWALWLEQLKLQSPDGLSPQNHDHIKFWKEHLAGTHPIPQLQGSSPGHHMGSPSSTETVHIPGLDVEVDSMHSGHKFRYSQHLAVGATALAVREVFGISDVVLGLPYMDRDEPPTANMIGFFLDTLPIRIQLNDTNLGRVDALLATVATEIGLCISNKLPYVQIQSAVTSISDNNQHSYGKLVDIMILYRWRTDSLLHSVSLGSNVHIGETGNRTRPAGSLFTIQVEFVEREDGGLLVELDYDRAIVLPEQVAALKAFLSVAVHALARGMTPVSIPSLNILFY